MIAATIRKIINLADGAGFMLGLLLHSGHENIVLNIQTKIKFTLLTTHDNYRTITSNHGGFAILSRCGVEVIADRYQTIGSAFLFGALAAIADKQQKGGFTPFNNSNTLDVTDSRQLLQI